MATLITSTPMHVSFFYILYFTFKEKIHISIDIPSDIVFNDLFDDNISDDRSTYGI